MYFIFSPESLPINIANPQYPTHPIKGIRYKISHFIANKDISDSEMENIFNNGKSKLIKGFKSKTGKKFNAYLVLNEDNEITFEFKK